MGACTCGCANSFSGDNCESELLSSRDNVLPKLGLSTQDSIYFVLAHYLLILYVTVCKS